MTATTEDEAQAEVEKTSRKKRVVTLPDGKLSYSLPEFAVATTIGVDMLRKYINEDKLVARYNGNRPIILREDGLEFLRSLPTEKPSK